MSITEEVAKFVVRSSYEDFPEDAITIAKYTILDSIGGMIGGIPEPVSRIVSEYAKEGGGVEEACVIGGGFKTSLTNAAFINGTTVHSQELESIGLYTGSNPMTNIPVAFPVADKLKLTGKDILEGTIIGLEVQTKLGMHCPGTFDRGFSSIPSFGSFGAVTTVGKMMRMDVEQIRNAFGVAASQCGGLQRQAGTMTHLLESGIGCRNGVVAALLAKRGMTAEPDAFEGSGGFADLFSSGGKGYSLDTLSLKLGNPWVVNSPGIFFKKYGCCFFIHRALDALLGLIADHDIQYQQVANVQVDVPTWIPRLVRFAEPENGAQTKFSMQHALGAAIADRRAELPYVRPFTDQGAVDPKYRDARKKVTVRVREDWTGGRSAPWSLPVTVTLADGSCLSRTTDKVKGGVDNPLTHEEFIERYTNMTKHFLNEPQIQKSAEMVLDLENLVDVSGLIDLLTFGAST